MLREDFKNHPLWSTLGEADEYIGSIRLDSPNSVDLSAVDVLVELSSHLRRWYTQRDRLSPYFNVEMLDAVQRNWRAVADQLLVRVSNGSGYFESTRAAAEYAEASLTPVGSWPALFPTKNQEESEQTVFEDILESQRLAMEAMDRRNAELLSKIDQLQSDLETRAATVEAAVASYESDAARIENTVATQSGRMDEAIDRATRTIGELNQQNSEAFDEWIDERTTEFSETFAPFQNRIESRLKTANEILAQLQETETAFANLSSASAADKLAGHFKKEAFTGRALGFVAYGLAVILAAGGVVPLIILIVESTNAGLVPEWPTVVIRLTISLVAASAAAVFVNLGSRFFTQATLSKRTELELRTINPLLANVEKRSAVDEALINLVDRSFGIPAPSGTSSKDEDKLTIPTNAIVELILNAVKRT